MGQVSCRGLLGRGGGALSAQRHRHYVPDLHLHLGGAVRSPEALRGRLADGADKAADGWACWAYSNHDVERHQTRWNLSPAAERAFTTLLMCLRGSACLYQGEEIGLPEAELSFADLQDPYGIEFWPEFKGRDGARTPMVWELSNLNAGFSTAPRTWLPVPSEHLRHSVGEAENEPSALIHHYRRAIAFRRAHKSLRVGEQSNMQVIGDVLSFSRTFDGETLFCAINLSDQPAEFVMPAGDWLQIGTELNSAHASADQIVRLGPWQPCLALKARTNTTEGT